MRVRKQEPTGVGVVWHINVKSGVHVVFRVIRGRVFYHRDVVAELSGKANRRFDAGMRYEADNDELMNAVLLELQIQVGIGKAAGAPMLVGDNFAWLWRKFWTDLATPRAVFEALAPPRCPLNGCNVLPGRIVAGTVPVMHGIEDPKFRFARRMQHLLHVRNAIVRFSHGFDPRPDLATLGNEVVVGVDHQESGDVLVIGGVGHGTLRCGGRAVAALPRLTISYS